MSEVFGDPDRIALGMRFHIISKEPTPPAEPVPEIADELFVFSC